MTLSPGAMPGSNDRLRRVRGYGRHRDGARIAAMLRGKGTPEDDMWAAADIGQPFATLVKLGSAGYTLCLFALSKPVVADKGASQRISGTRLRLVASTSGGNNREDSDDVSLSMPMDEATGGTPPTTSKDDVDTIWSWVGGRTVGTREDKIPATLAIPVNPCFDDRLENVCFSLGDLQTLAGNLEFQLERMNEVVPHMVDYSANGIRELPYHSSVVITQLAGEAVEVDRVNCRVCDRKGVPIEDMRAHIGAHILDSEVTEPLYYCTYQG